MSEESERAAAELVAAEMMSERFGDALLVEGHGESYAIMVDLLARAYLRGVASGLQTGANELRRIEHTEAAG